MKSFVVPTVVLYAANPYVCSQNTSSIVMARLSASLGTFSAVLSLREVTVTITTS
jgi:hypothetical protein